MSNMQFISVSINNQLVELGSPLPNSIYEFSVLLLMNATLDAASAVALKAWLNSIIDRLDTDYVSYNNVLIPTNELVKF